MMFSNSKKILWLSLLAGLPVWANAEEIHVETEKITNSTNLHTITLDGASLFQFNQDKLSDKGQAALDALLQSNALFPLERYKIIGHSDHLGNKRRNTSLSLRRAKAVQHYLSTHNANLKLESEGAGDSQPKVQCDKKLPRDQLIECLSPNRRVEIKRIDGH